MMPPLRIELRAYRLQGGCSTTRAKGARRFSIAPCAELKGLLLVGLEPTTSRSLQYFCRRRVRYPVAPKECVRRPGIEPGLQPRYQPKPWKGCILPLNYRRYITSRYVFKPFSAVDGRIKYEVAPRNSSL
jgi:hypothetical protein